MKTTTLLYVAKAEDNFAISLEVGERTAAHRGWQATLLFYAALFWVRAYFEEFDIVDRPSHHKRMILVETTEELAHIAEDFAKLQDVSQDARYALPEIRESALGTSKTSYARLQSHIDRLLRANDATIDEDDPLSESPGEGESE